MTERIKTIDELNEFHDKWVKPAVREVGEAKRRVEANPSSENEANYERLTKALEAVSRHWWEELQRLIAKT